MTSELLSIYMHASTRYTLNFFTCCNMSSTQYLPGDGDFKSSKGCNLSEHLIHCDTVFKVFKYNIHKPSLYKGLFLLVFILHTGHLKLGMAFNMSSDSAVPIQPG